MQPGKAQEYFHRYRELSSVVQCTVFCFKSSFKIAVEIEIKWNFFEGKQANLENITILSLTEKLNTYLHIFFRHASACFSNEYVININ